MLVHVKYLLGRRRVTATVLGPGHRPTMYIPKIVRVPIYFAISFTAVAVTVALTRPAIGWLSIPLGLLLFPIFNVLGGAPVDAVDLWLRRKTKDPIWLMTREGEEWLQTDEGQHWSRQRANS